MIGLSDKSTEQTITVPEDNKLVTYSVTKSEVDIEALKRERESLQYQLGMKEPSGEELAELGKLYHPYFQPNRDQLENRLAEIYKIIGE